MADLGGNIEETDRLLADDCILRNTSPSKQNVQKIICFSSVRDVKRIEEKFEHMSQVVVRTLSTSEIQI